MSAIQRTIDDFDVGGGGETGEPSEADGCDHLDAYTVAGSCMRCGERDGDADREVVRELTRDASTHEP